MGTRAKKPRGQDRPPAREIMAGEEPVPGVLLAGVEVEQWFSQVEMAGMFNVDVRTLSGNWRAMGLPSHRAADGKRWYALPHTLVWWCCLNDWRQGGKRRIDHVPFAVAWARKQYENACSEANVAYHARPFDSTDDAPGREPA